MTALQFSPDAIEQVPIDSLRAYARNPRLHSDDQVAKLAASLVEFGWTVPVLVDDAGEVIAGHGRLMAARKLGVSRVPVIRLSHLTPEQARGYRVADNQLTLLGEWDEAALAEEAHWLNGVGYNLDLLGFDNDELTRLMAPLDGTTDSGESGLAGEDQIPETPEDPVTRTGDLWILGEHRLLCGDSTKADDVIRVMNGESAILFATDPPYLVDYDGTNHPSKQGGPDKNKDWGESYGITWDDASGGAELYETFIRTAIEHAIEPNAAWYCWHASRRQAMLEGVWQKVGAFVHQQLIWAKNNPVLTRSYYLWKHEPCFFGWMKGNMPPKNTGVEWAPTVWQIDTLAGDDRPEHPTPKPIDCFAIPMRQHVTPGQVCYEPFSGSGSQIIAGEMTGRRVFAIEISPQYVDVAVKRWQLASLRQAILEGDGRSFDALAGERLPAAA